MAYIGKQPTIGNFVKLDAITTSATATYNLLNGGVAYSPQSANHCIVSLNGVIQEPTTSGDVGGFSISGSTIVFTSALTSNDVIDFILVLGDVLNIGTPSDATVGFAKVTSNLITGATAETSIAGGDSVLIYDDSASALRKMTRTNFVAGIGATAGQVIQVVSTDYTGTASSTSATPADVSGFSATITPASASNKILIFVSVNFGGADDSYPYVLLKRNGTSISVGTTATGNQINTFLSGAITNVGGSVYVFRAASKSFLDTPSSTSALTYQIQLAAPFAGNAGYINRQSNTSNEPYIQFPTSSITLMEIKG